MKRIRAVYVVMLFIVIILTACGNKPITTEEVINKFQSSKASSMSLNVIYDIDNKASEKEVKVHGDILISDSGVVSGNGSLYVNGSISYSIFNELSDDVNTCAYVTVNDSEVISYIETNDSSWFVARDKKSDMEGNMGSLLIGLMENGTASPALTECNGEMCYLISSDVTFSQVRPLFREYCNYIPPIKDQYAIIDAAYDNTINDVPILLEIFISEKTGYPLKINITSANNENVINISVNISNTNNIEVNIPDEVKANTYEIPSLSNEPEEEEVLVTLEESLTENGIGDITSNISQIFSGIGSENIYVDIAENEILVNMYYDDSAWEEKDRSDNIAELEKSIDYSKVYDVIDSLHESYGIDGKLTVYMTIYSETNGEILVSHVQKR